MKRHRFLPPCYLASPGNAGGVVLFHVRGQALAYGFESFRPVVLCLISAENKCGCGGKTVLLADQDGDSYNAAVVKPTLTCTPS